MKGSNKWKPTVAALKEVKHEYCSFSKERLKRQHDAGKLTARERLALLFDDNTFTETGPFRSHSNVDFGMKDILLPSDGVVTGYGKVDGRYVCAFAQDFTVMGGSLGYAHAQKIVDIMHFARDSGYPIIGINDSGGARIQEGIDALAGYGEIFHQNTLTSGIVPQISLVMGPCAGGATYSPALTDFIFMVDSTAKMFLTGPDVIRVVTGENVSAEELGGASQHAAKSGVVHVRAKSEKECIASVKHLLSYLPSSYQSEISPSKEYKGKTNYLKSLNDLVPERASAAYDMKDIIKAVADNEEFFEIHSEWAQNIIVGFIRVDGYTIGIVANQPRVKAGCLDIDTSDKASRFIRFCDSFKIPLLTLVDVPGFLPGVAQEHGGIIRHGAKLLSAYSEATVPKVTIIVRKAYGGAYVAMCPKHLGADRVLAWPTAEIAVMGAEGAINIVYRNELRQAANQQEARQQFIKEYKNVASSPLVAAKKGYVDDIIEPGETRIRISTLFAMLRNKNIPNLSQKHIIAPV